MKRNIPISVIVSVKNEERNLPNCLRVLGDFSEVLIIDSMSTDNTPQIVEDFNFKLINFKWNGRFPKKRNWTLRNISIKNEWVLFLDADETLTEVFIDEIAQAIKDTSFDGFWIRYNNYFMGKELKYGDKMSKLAMFKKSSGEYEKIDEDSWSHLDMEIHEHPIIKGSIGFIKSPIKHNDFNGLKHYINKHNAYSTWEAKRFLSLRKNSTEQLTKRQKIKYKLITTGWLPFIYFTYAYLLKRGFLDGKQGYFLSKYKSYYFFQIQTKIKELGKSS